MHKTTSANSQNILAKTKYFIIILLMSLGYNLSFAQDGSLDLSFDPGTGANDFIHTTSLQSDGKIIIGGKFTSYNGLAINRIARIHTDGSLDTSFNPGTGADDGVNNISIQSDGNIIIGGDFTSFNGTTRKYIARLNTDGSHDLSFNPGTGANGSIWNISIQNNGKIIICGNFFIFNGTSIYHIARLNTDGSLDTSFNPGTGANDFVFTSTIQSDGKIIIGGKFTSYNGLAINRIARINTDGSLDNSFNPGTGVDFLVRTTSIQSDGKIIIGGLFTSYNGTTRNRIARINADGSLDTSFNPGTGANNYVYTTSIQSDEKIIVGGSFTSYNGTTRNSITRLNKDGGLDTSFNPGTGANQLVNTTTIQSDERIIVGGGFTSYNGTTRNSIARVNSTISGIHQWVDELKKVYVFPNPFSFTSTLHSEIELKNAVLTLYNSYGQLVRNIEKVSGFTYIIYRDNLPAGIYYLGLSQGPKNLLKEKVVITD